MQIKDLKKGKVYRYRLMKISNVFYTKKILKVDKKKKISTLMDMKNKLEIDINYDQEVFDVEEIAE